MEKMLPTEMNEVQRAVLKAEKSRSAFVSIRRQHAEMLLEMLNEENQREEIAGFQSKLSEAETELRRVRNLLSDHEIAMRNLHNKITAWTSELDEARSSRSTKRKAG